MVEKRKEDILERDLQDKSTRVSFKYSIRCQCCGAEFASQPIPFSYQDEIAADAGRRMVLDVLRRREQVEARRQALTALSNSISICSICDRCICDECFLICQDIDLCRDCAEILGISGENVTPRSG